MLLHCRRLLLHDHAYPSIYRGQRESIMFLGAVVPSVVTSDGFTLTADALALSNKSEKVVLSLYSLAKSLSNWRAAILS